MIKSPRKCSSGSLLLFSSCSRKFSLISSFSPFEYVLLTLDFVSLGSSSSSIEFWIFSDLLNTQGMIKVFFFRFVFMSFPPCCRFALNLWSLFVVLNSLKVLEALFVAIFYITISPFVFLKSNQYFHAVFFIYLLYIYIFLLYQLSILSAHLFHYL